MPILTYAQFNTVEKEKKILTVKSETKGKKEVIMLTNIVVVPEERFLNERDSTKISLLKRRILFSLPLQEIEINSPYGMREDPFTKKNAFHTGIDLRASNDKVYSMMPGEIIKTGKNKRLGNFIEIEHGNFSVVYGHLRSINVKKGEFVEAGESVGISGNTGRSTGEHLHLSMKYRKKQIDPYPILEYIIGAISEIEAKLSLLEEQEVIHHISNSVPSLN